MNMRTRQPASLRTARATRHRNQRTDVSDNENNPWAPPSATPPSSPPNRSADDTQEQRPAWTQNTGEHQAWPSPTSGPAGDRFDSWSTDVDTSPAHTRRFANPAWRWIGVVVVAALVGGVVGSATSHDDSKNASSTKSTVPASQASNASATPSTIRSVLDKVKPAVVTIQSDESGGGTGTGTGMIVDPNGYILTNAHVVKGGTNIRVTLDGEKTSRPGTVLGMDTSIDSAMVKIDDSNLPTVDLGDSESAQVGDEVVAIGNALALPGGPSVTTGIVSARDRSVSDGTTSLDNLIQTDAAINPGNSGGPLTNMAGQIIGMNTAVIRGQNGEFQNVGFALAIDTIKPALNDLRSGKVTAQAYLGVSTITLTDDIKSRFGVTPDKGAMVYTVSPNSPADQAGLSQYDVITKFDGKDVTSNDDLSAFVRPHHPGDKVSVEYFAGGKTQKDITVSLGTRPDTND
jgi:serine protease Do